MLKEYIKKTHTPIRLSKILVINIFSHLLYICTFFAIPLLIRKYIIIGNFASSLIKITCLFLFEASFIPSCIATMHLLNEKRNTDFSLKKALHTGVASLIFAFIKTAHLSLSLYFFRIAMKMHIYLAFLICTIFFSVLCFSFWVPAIVANQSYANKKPSIFSSFLISIKLFISFPFFSSCVFLHSLILHATSNLFFYIYPGQARIFFNINIAYGILKSKKNTRK